MYQPQDHDLYRGPIAKSSGKAAPWQIFVKTEGQQRFRREHGMPYIAKDQNHSSIMSGYWRALTEQEQQHYKDLAKGDINSEENRRNRRHAAEAKRRDNAHQNADLEYEAKMAHRENIERIQMQQRAAFGPATIPSKPKIADANTAYKQNFKAYRRETRAKLAEILRISSAQENLWNYNYTFVGVTAGSIRLDDQKGLVLPVPMEVSVVTFHLKEGLKSFGSYHLDVHPKYCDITDFADDKRQMVDIAEYFGLNRPTFTENANHMADGWEWFMEMWAQATENSTEKSKIFCEKKIFNQVLFSLRILANKAGMADWNIYSKDIEKKMMPIEDFALALRDVAAPTLPESKVLQYFDRKMCPNEDAFYCSQVHEQLDRADTKRYMCQQARGVMAVHNLYDFLNNERLFKMENVYSDLHNLCAPYDGPENEWNYQERDKFIEFGMHSKQNRMRDFVVRPSVTANDLPPDQVNLANFVDQLNPSESRMDGRPADEEYSDGGGPDEGDDDDVVPAFCHASYLQPVPEEFNHNENYFPRNPSRLDGYARPGPSREAARSPPRATAPVDPKKFTVQIYDSDEDDLPSQETKRQEAQRTNGNGSEQYRQPSRSQSSPIQEFIPPSGAVRVPSPNAERGGERDFHYYRNVWPRVDARDIEMRVEEDPRRLRRHRMHHIIDVFGEDQF